MKVAVFGAGTMGSGIAQVFAAKGHTALMYASSVASAQRHKDKLAASLQKRVEKGKMTEEWCCRYPYLFRTGCQLLCSLQYLRSR